VGIVAHFYMDPEVQGVLAAAAKQWPHIHISDSLVMADKAVAMAQAGCTAVAVLGVDFMTENVRAVMDGAGAPSAIPTPPAPHHQFLRHSLLMP
jgi:quinolinate synthase